jgi:hypothetical protein
MVTAVPGAPEAGVKAFMTGCAKQFNDIHNSKKEKNNPFRRDLGSVIGEIIRA